MMPPRTMEVNTWPIEANKLIRAVGKMLQRCVRATTASGTQ